MLTKVDDRFFKAIPKRDLGPALVAYLNKCRYQVDIQNNFTIVTILHDRDKKVVTNGVAKRLPADKPNEEIGFRIAAARAVRAIHGR